jgi:N6-L-threonylcarbamoyladenine synthase
VLSDHALILGIETSCDDTSASVLEGGRRIRSNVVASQVAVHRPYGGVVPELASRHHILSIGPVIEEALSRAGVGWGDIAAVAATRGPGLVGSLLVGVSVGKAIAFARRLPLVGVNHLEGHIRSNFLADPEIPLPAVSLVVSGGHTSLYEVTGAEPAGASPGSGGSAGPGGAYRRLARTRDDAAGEAFDKLAKLLGLGYPGGPVIDRLAERGDPRGVRFAPVKMTDGSLDFSFSGLKTAAARFVREHGLEAAAPAVNLPRADAPEAAAAAGLSTAPAFEPAEPLAVVLDLCASFRRAVVETLADRAFRAARQVGARSVCVSGGVACNLELRRRFTEEAAGLGLAAHFPPPSLSTDNAAMIAAAGWVRLGRGETSGWDLTADPDLEL